MHNFPGGHNSGGDGGVGGHAYSKSGLEWTYSSEPAYTTSLQVEPARTIQL